MGCGRHPDRAKRESGCCEGSGGEEAFHKKLLG
jgi:hypothetical protein